MDICHKRSMFRASGSKVQSDGNSLYLIVDIV